MTTEVGQESGHVASLRRLLSEGPSAFVFVGLSGIIALVPGLAVPLLIRTLLDQYLIAGDTEWAVPIVVGLSAAAVLAGALSWLQFRVLSEFAVRLSATRSTAFVWRTLRVPIPDVDALGVGDVTARGSAIQRLAYQGGVFVPLALVKIFTVAIFGLALIALDARLGVTAIAVVIISMLMSVGILRSRAARQMEADRTRVSQSALTSDVIASIETIKASAAEQWIFDRWCRSRDVVGQATSELGISGQSLGTVGLLTPTVGLGVVLGIGSWLVLIGQLSLGTLVASQTLLLQILIPAGQLVWLGVLIGAVASVERQAAAVQDLSLDPEVRPVPADEQAALAIDFPVGVSVRDVTFGYVKDEQPLLRGIDLDVAAGSRVALVGGTGSGKSTLLRLVIGELQPWSGEVLLGGAPRLHVPRAARSRAVAYVPQTPVLVPGTIRENITLFDDGVSDEEVLLAIRDACIEDAIAARPLGLSEEVGASGDGFSGGELQRLTIARALCTRPRLLVLDEATSALDPVVESQLEDNLRARNCTCLIVAHRLSTVRDADRILVLDGGCIVQQGRYEELKKVGRFAELVNA